MAASLNAYLGPAIATLPLIANRPNPLPAGIGWPAQAATPRTDGMLRSASPSSLRAGAPTPLPAELKLIGVDAIFTLIGVGWPPSNAAGRPSDMSRLSDCLFHATEPDADIGLSRPAIAIFKLIASASRRFPLRVSALLAVPFLIWRVGGRARASV